jgi:hypothetical protein
MNKATLEFTVVIKADKVTLCNIQQHLAHSQSNLAPLADKLSGIIKQTLIAVVPDAEFEVELRRGHLSTPCAGLGGLSEDMQEEVYASPLHRVEEEAVHAAESQAGSLFTD